MRWTGIKFPRNYEMVRGHISCETQLLLFVIATESGDERKAIDLYIILFLIVFGFWKIFLGLFSRKLPSQVGFVKQARSLVYHSMKRS